MAFDAHKNLAISAVVTAPTPATSGTSLSVTAGEGARFPVAPFNATVWPANAMPTPANGEVIRVTARATDVLTITRAQEGSTARPIGSGDLIAATITAKTLTDLETRAALKDEANVFIQPQTIQMAGLPKLSWVDTTLPANTDRVALLTAGGTTYLQTQNAAGGTLANLMAITQDGDVYATRNVHEKNRAVPLGHWQVGDVSSYTQTAGFSGPYHWTLIGKTLLLVMLASGTMAGGAGSYVFNLPAGLTPAVGSAAAVVALYTGASWTFASAQFSAGSPAVTVYRDQLTAWPAGATYIQACLLIPIS